MLAPVDAAVMDRVTFLDALETVSEAHCIIGYFLDCDVAARGGIQFVEIYALRRTCRRARSVSWYDPLWLRSWAWMCGCRGNFENGSGCAMFWRMRGWNCPAVLKCQCEPCRQESSPVDDSTVPFASARVWYKFSVCRQYVARAFCLQRRLIEGMPVLWFSYVDKINFLVMSEVSRYMGPYPYDGMGLGWRAFFRKHGAGRLHHGSLLLDRAEGFILANAFS